MRLLIDTNIVLDVLLKREPFYKSAAEVLNLTQYDDIKEYISATTVTDIYYIAYRQIKDKMLVRDLLRKLLDVVSVAAVSGEDIKKALELDWKDFEDAVQYSVALLGDMEGIVTRNPKDYKKAGVNVWLPEQILQEYHNV